MMADSAQKSSIGAIIPASQLKRRDPGKDGGCPESPKEEPG